MQDKAKNNPYRLCTARKLRYVNNCHGAYAIWKELVKLRHKKEMNLGKCPLCGETTNTESVDITESLDGKIVLIKDIKAEVCSQCDERLYSSSEMKKLKTCCIK